MSRSRATAVIGIDPGPTTGLALLLLDDRETVITHRFTLRQEESDVTAVVTAWLAGTESRTTYVQIEKYVVSNKSARAGTALAGEVTRNQIGALFQCAAAGGAVVHLASASQVKPWATNKRLAAFNLLDRTEGQPHARDAARHALFAAVQRGLLPDPLSKEFRT